MDIKIFCVECKVEKFVKNIEIDRDGVVVIDIERCPCEDEERYETGFGEGQEFERNGGH